jgi:hypothetical protein
MYQPCSTRLPCSRSHAISMTLDESEFTAEVPDSRRYAQNSAAAITVKTATAFHRNRPGDGAVGWGGAATTAGARRIG